MPYFYRPEKPEPGIKLSGYGWMFLLLLPFMVWIAWAGPDLLNKVVGVGGALLCAVVVISDLRLVGIK